MTILYFLIVLLVIVNAHELGHFLFCKLFGVRVDEFAFGFPPRIFSRVMGKTRYSLNLLPLGGFVRIYGKDSEDPKALKAKDGFGGIRFLKKLAIISGGVIFNILLTFVIFYFLFLSGYPNISSSDNKAVIQRIERNSEAARIGLKVGDEVVALNGAALGSYEDVSNIIKQNEGKTVVIEVKRSGEVLEFEGVPRPLLGITVSPITLTKGSVFDSLCLAAKETATIFKETAVGFVKLLGSVFSGGVRVGELSGPVGIAKISNGVANLGSRFFWQFVGVLSVNLAILNFLPLPALDGGWVLVTMLERIRKRQFSQRVLGVYNTLGLVFIGLLLLFVTYQDLFVNR